MLQIKVFGTTPPRSRASPPWYTGVSSMCRVVTIEVLTIAAVTSLGRVMSSSTVNSTLTRVACGSIEVTRPTGMPSTAMSLPSCRPGTRSK